MIAYFDTSAVVPLLVAEPATERCVRIWNEATSVASARLLYPEARAALARAERLDRLTGAQLAAAVAELDAMVDEVDIVELSADLARRAGDLAQEHGLRGYDAVHLAAALALANDDLVVVTGDAELAAAAEAEGIAVAPTPS